MIRRPRSSIVSITAPLVHRLCCNRATGELLGLVRSIHPKSRGHRYPNLTVYVPIVTPLGSPDTLVLGEEEAPELEVSDVKLTTLQLVEMLLALKGKYDHAVREYGREDRWSFLLWEIYASTVADVGQILRANALYTDEVYQHVRDTVMLGGRQRPQ